MKKKTKKTIKQVLEPTGITISFTRKEVDWLARVMEDALYCGLEKPNRANAAEFEAMVEFADPVFRSACQKLMNAEKLLKNVEKVLHERTKVRKVDARKRQAPRPRRKGARR